LFSFAIEISDDEGEEASSSQAIGISSAEIRAKLEDLLACYTKTLLNWSITLIQPKLCSKLLGVKSQPMPRKLFSKLHTWKAVSSSIKRLPSVLLIGPPTPSSQRK